MDIDFYNASSAEKLGWSPAWFGCNYFDDELVDAIKEFQAEMKIKPDGMCGPNTFRRKFTQREADIGRHLRHISPHRMQQSITYNGKSYPIEWPHVVLWDDSDGSGLGNKKGSYRPMADKPLRDVKLMVVHWDAALNSHSTSRILAKRGLSCHFLIDNDGTIYQTADLQDVCFHAGKVNNFSIGVEISNAFYPKYQQWYIRNGYGERPMVPETKINGGKVETHLGFYPKQIGALRALARAVHQACGIPLATPPEGNLHYPAVTGNYRGFVHHYQITKKKIDCAGLDLETII